jgi:hypothetical protein
MSCLLSLINEILAAGETADAHIVQLKGYGCRATDRIRSAERVLKCDICPVSGNPA